jgi:hypothetical protein
MPRIRFVVPLLAIFLAAAPAARADDDLLTQFHLGPYTGLTTKVTLKAGTTYIMKIAGSRKRLEGQGHFSNNDAFYCFESDAAGFCPPAKPEPMAAGAISMSTGESTALPLQSYVIDEQPYPGFPGWTTPLYAATHKYVVKVRPKQTGKLFLSTAVICGGAPQSCNGEGFDIQVFRPNEDDPCAATVAHASAVNEVRVVAVAQGAAAHKAGTPEDQWVTLCKDTVLQQGDEISLDPDGAATLQFADNSTVVVKNTTQLKIASFFTEGGVVKTEILLKMGEIAAQVHKSEATKSDFRIKSPTGTVSVRGTDFSVFYDPGTKAMLVWVREGLVEVDPVNDALATAQVPASKEVEVTAKAISPVAAIGKAGARGGLNRLAALAKVLKVIARGNGPCKVRTPRTNAFAVRTAPGGWAISVKLTGKRKGTSQWSVMGKRVTPKNALAKRIAKRCR